jgi:ribosome-binding factor A
VGGPRDQRVELRSTTDGEEESDAEELNPTRERKLTNHGAERKKQGGMLPNGSRVRVHNVGHDTVSFPNSPAMFVCRPLAPPRLLAVAPPGTARGPWSLRPPSLSLRVVRCMAKEKRVRMVAKQIQRELADMLTRDPILQRAVLPEAALGADRYLSSLTTLRTSSSPTTSRSGHATQSRHVPKRLISCAGDAEFTCAQVCKVYVSVFGDERGKKVAIEGLKAKTKYVRSQIGKWMKLRLTPGDKVHRGLVHGAWKQGMIQIT